MQGNASTSPQHSNTSFAAQYESSRVPPQRAGSPPEPVDMAETHKADVRVWFSIVSSESPLTKTFKLSADGSIEKSGKTTLYRGLVSRVALHGSPCEVMKQLADKLVALTAKQAVLCAPPPAGQDEWTIVRNDDLSFHPGAISRTKENFRPSNGVALLALDFDTADFPQDLLEKIRHAGSISAALALVHPGFANAASIMRKSASSSVAVQGQRPKDKGQHRFYLISDGSRVDEFVRGLADRLMLAGFLWGRITATGTVLPRTLFDVGASCDPSRLVYEADPIIDGDRLVVMPGSREPRLSGEAILDVDTVEPLTNAERSTLAAMVAQLQKDLEPQAAAIRQEWRNRRIEELTRRGVDRRRAERTVAGAIEHHELCGDFEVLLDDGSTVTVREILADPERYHKQTCADPMDWDYDGGVNKAVIFADQPPRRIHSLAHGGIEYRLVRPVEELLDVLDDLPAPDDVARWPEPIDIFGDSDPGELATPPAGCLPAILEQWTKSEARRKGVPEAFAAAAAVTAVAAAIGNSLRIYPRLNDDSWSEPAAFWCTLVAPPGSGKSPLITEAIKPLKQLDKECWQRNKAAREAWEHRKRGRKKDIAPEPRPQERRYVVDDTTLEQQARLHADNPRGLLRATDEFVGLLSSLGAYKKNADGDRSQTLRLYDGGAIIIDRVGAGTTYVDNALMSVLAGSQPEKIRTLVRDLGSDGFLQRVNFIMDDGVKRRGVDEAPNWEILRRYEALMRELATRQHGNAKPFRLTAQAAEYCDQAQQQIEALADLPGASEAWGGHVRKWGKMLPRLILVFHCVEQWEFMEAVTPEVPVELPTVERAVLFGRFLLRHSLHFYETFFGSAAETNEARWIAGYLLTRPDLTKPTRRSISDARKSLRSDLRAIQAAMRELESFGWVQTSKRDDHGPVQWEVNPRVHERFALRAEWERREREIKRERIQTAGAARKNWLNSDSLSVEAAG